MSSHHTLCMIYHKYWIRIGHHLLVFFHDLYPNVKSFILSSLLMDEQFFFWQMLLMGLNFGFVINRYFRSGAPPVINPLHTRFPRDTVVPGSFAVTLTWTLPNRTTGAFNVTSPLPGDWFLAAHLPKDEGKISVKVCCNIS